MTTTNVLATAETVKALEGMDFTPIKVLEALGYTYTGETTQMAENEEWSEHRYTGVNPENPEDIAVVTVGWRDDRDNWDKQYIYLENEDGEDWRYEIYVKDGIVTRCCKILTPADALKMLKESVIGKRLGGCFYEEELGDDDDIEVIDWDDVCTDYDLQLHGTSWIEQGDANYKQIGFDEIKVAVLYIATEDSPEVTLWMDDYGEIYNVD
ncbi:hypothetical protein [Hominisplanchenecus sp.]|uniref:hypothetical protein n=1 Tax=Hominisplanchenecus sp. TaxID=3038130 RepID=UPI0039952756